MFKTHFTSVDVVFFVRVIPFVVYVTGDVVFFVGVIAVVDVAHGVVFFVGVVAVVDVARVVVFVVGVIAAVVYVALGLYMLVQRRRKGTETHHFVLHLDRNYLLGFHQHNHLYTP